LKSSRFLCLAASASGLASRRRKSCSANFCSLK
jgi:hypothetical protein